MNWIRKLADKVTTAIQNIRKGKTRPAMAGC